MPGTPQSLVAGYGTGANWATPMHEFKIIGRQVADTFSFQFRAKNVLDEALIRISPEKVSAKHLDPAINCPKDPVQRLQGTSLVSTHPRRLSGSKTQTFSVPLFW